jgi:cytoskeletal protein RodZ
MYESFSRAMREARESMGISREELARRARVPLLVVRNLEEGRWSELPEEVYLFCP